MKTLFTLVESPSTPHFPQLYLELGIEAVLFDSARNLHRALQKKVPDFFVGEFMYGWGNDYAGNTLCNLDVTLRTLQFKAPKAKIIVTMHAREAPHIDKLLAHFPVHAVLKYPVLESDMRALLTEVAT